MLVGDEHLGFHQPRVEHDALFKKFWVTFDMSVRSRIFNYGMQSAVAMFGSRQVAARQDEGFCLC